MKELKKQELMEVNGGRNAVFELGELYGELIKKYPRPYDYIVDKWF